MSNLTNPNDPIYTQNPNWLRPGESVEQYNKRVGRVAGQPPSTSTSISSTPPKTSTKGTLVGISKVLGSTVYEKYMDENNVAYEISRPAQVGEIYQGSQFTARGEWRPLSTEALAGVGKLTTPITTPSKSEIELSSPYNFINNKQSQTIQKNQQSNLTNPNDPIYQQNPNWLRPGETVEQWKARTGYAGETGAITTPTVPQSGGQYFNHPAIKSRDLIIAGQTITVSDNINKQSRQYTIKPGDSLSKIASKFGTTIDAILKDNNVQQGVASTSGQGGATGASGASGGAMGVESTPEQQAQQQKEQVMKELQALLDGGQAGSTTAVTGQTVNAPDAPNYETEYENLRTKYAVEPLETDLADIDTKINDLIALTESAVLEEGKRLGPNAIIAARKNKITDEQRIEFDRLTRQKIAIQEQLNTKYKTIDTLMNLKGKSYDDAYQQYTTQFNQAIQTQQLLGQKSDDARASLTTMTNLFSGSGLQWTDLSYDQQISIAKMEMTAGMPIGTIQAFMISKPNTKLISIGGQLVYQNADGSIGVAYSAPKTTSEPVSQTREQVTSAYVNSKRGGDGLIAWETYVDAGKLFISKGGTLANFKASYPAETLMNAANLKLLPEGYRPAKISTNPYK